MNDRDRKKIRERLLEERRDTLEALANFDERFRERLESQTDGDLSKYPLHMADEGTDTMEQEKDFLLASNEGRQLMEIEEALRVLYKQPDDFGACDRCGKQISMARLDVVPWAKMCIDCKNAVEAGEETPAA